jgi:FKBP-type peptidyl-prolyl cis-trans isomerase FkpA
MLQKILTFSLLIILAASCKKDVTDYGPIDDQIIKDYLVSHNLTAQSTSSGLYYIIEKPGGTNHPDLNSVVVANYKGYFTDDAVFEQSTSAATFGLNAVIKGWQEGLQLIGVKGKIKLFVPSALAYGSTGKGSVPANTVIIFDVELLEFY